MNKNILSNTKWIGILALVIFFCFGISGQAYSKSRNSSKHARPHYPSLHIDAMEGALVSGNAGVKGKVVVTITDGNNQPVADAQIIGKWGGLVRGRAFGITGEDGTASFISESTFESGVISFQVKYAGAYGYRYNRSQNAVDQIEISTDEVDTNLAPEVIISADRVSAPTQSYFSLCGSKSYDQDGSIVKYTWDLGDGTRVEGCTVNHYYNKPGDYNARLTVTDDKGQEASDELLLNVTDPDADS
ncbi:MAG: PKD domain-containing protein [Desulfobacteraceae bacterium]|nr:MAG: PKD domain-containing protein [Desulfobacteraceae bacterium]